VRSSAFSGGIGRSFVVTISMMPTGPDNLRLAHDIADDGYVRALIAADRADAGLTMLCDPAVLFGSYMPDRFGHLGTSLFTLFQVMTTDDWAAVAGQAMETHPLAWIFFVVYILVSTFAVLNLFIAVVVRAMEQQVAADMEANVAERQREDAVTTAAILDEVPALRLELAELRRNANP
jgi:fatty acid desaturase